MKLSNVPKLKLEAGTATHPEFARQSSGRDGETEWLCHGEGGVVRIKFLAANASAMEDTQNPNSPSPHLRVITSLNSLSKQITERKLKGRDIRSMQDMTQSVALDTQTKDTSNTKENIISNDPKKLLNLIKINSETAKQSQLKSRIHMPSSITQCKTQPERHISTIKRIIILLNRRRATSPCQHLKRIRRSKFCKKPYSLNVCSKIFPVNSYAKVLKNSISLVFKRKATQKTIANRRATSILSSKGKVSRKEANCWVLNYFNFIQHETARTKLFQRNRKLRRLTETTKRDFKSSPVQGTFSPILTKAGTMEKTRSKKFCYSFRNHVPSRTRGVPTSENSLYCKKSSNRARIELFNTERMLTRGRVPIKTTKLKLSLSNSMKKKNTTTKPTALRIPTPNSNKMNNNLQSPAINKDALSLRRPRESPDDQGNEWKKQKDSTQTLMDVGDDQEELDDLKTALSGDELDEEFKKLAEDERKERERLQKIQKRLIMPSKLNGASSSNSLTSLSDSCLSNGAGYEGAKLTESTASNKEVAQVDYAAEVKFERQRREQAVYAEMEAKKEAALAQAQITELKRKLQEMEGQKSLSPNAGIQLDARIEEFISNQQARASGLLNKKGQFTGVLNKVQEHPIVNEEPNSKQPRCDNSLIDLSKYSEDDDLTVALNGSDEDIIDALWENSCAKTKTTMIIIPRNYPDTTITEEQLQQLKREINNSFDQNGLETENKFEETTFKQGVMAVICRTLGTAAYLHSLIEATEFAPDLQCKPLTRTNNLKPAFMLWIQENNENFDKVKKHLKPQLGEQVDAWIMMRRYDKEPGSRFLFLGDTDLAQKIRMNGERRNSSGPLELKFRYKAHSLKGTVYHLKDINETITRQNEGNIITKLFNEFFKISFKSAPTSWLVQRLERLFSSQLLLELRQKKGNELVKIKCKSTKLKRLRNQLNIEFKMNELLRTVKSTIKTKHNLNYSKPLEPFFTVTRAVGYPERTCNWLVVLIYCSKITLEIKKTICITAHWKKHHYPSTGHNPQIINIKKNEIECFTSSSHLSYAFKDQTRANIKNSCDLITIIREMFTVLSVKSINAKLNYSYVKKSNFPVALQLKEKVRKTKAYKCKHKKSVNKKSCRSYNLDLLLSNNSSSSAPNNSYKTKNCHSELLRTFPQRYSHGNQGMNRKTHSNTSCMIAIVKRGWGDSEYG